MSFKVTKERFTAKYELTNLLLTALLCFVPLIVLQVFSRLLPSQLSVLVVCSSAILLFSIWIFEAVGAVIVPVRAASGPASTEPFGVSVVITAYLPSEEHIILDAVLHALSYTRNLSASSEVILSYRTPRELAVDPSLRELARRNRDFHLLEVDTGIGRPEQMNEALKLCSSEHVQFIDADARPKAISKERLWSLVSSYDIVQGSQVIRDANHLLGKLVAVELSTEYLLSYFARGYWTKVAYFCGSNGVWKREVAKRILFSASTLIEDVDSSVRAYLRGYEIVVQPEIESLELAPPKLKDWWDQRRRWGQGYIQVGRQFLRALISSKKLSNWRKTNWLYTIYGREIGYAYALLALLQLSVIHFVSGSPWTHLERDIIGISFALLFATGFIQVPALAFQIHRFGLERLPITWCLIYALLYPVYQVLKSIVTISGLADELLGRRVYRVTPRT